MRTAYRSAVVVAAIINGLQQRPAALVLVHGFSSDRVNSSTLAGSIAQNSVAFIKYSQSLSIGMN